MDKQTLNKLKQLQKIRVRTQEKLLSIDKKSYMDACDVLEKRNSSISDIHEENNRVNTYASNDYVIESPVHRDRVHIRKFWLDYDLEMHEYYHEQELNSKIDAESVYVSRKKLWNKEKQKSDLLNKRLSKLMIQENALAENRDDELSQEDTVMNRGEP